MSNATGKVSVIIPAFNEEKNIVNCLESMAKQAYENIEVILVDDCSTDNTQSVAEEFAKKLGLNLNLIKLEKHQERGKARNFGAQKSKGDYLLFIDADMKLDKNLVSDCVKKVAAEKNIKAIIIPELSYGLGFWAQCRELEKRCYMGDDMIEAARFFERGAFWEVGGWDENMISGEDWDLTTRFRSKYRIDRIKSFIYHNEGKLTLWKTAKKKFYYASKSNPYLKKYPLKIPDLIFIIFRPAYFRNWKLILSDPIHGVGMFILKFIEMLAGALGLLFSKLPNLS